jgi:hypothetical protein
MRRFLPAYALGAMCLVPQDGVLAETGLPPYRLHTAAREVAGASLATTGRATTTPLNVTQAPQVRWELLGKSVEGRAIEFAQFGAGARQVLVVGSLAGDEPEGVAAAEVLAANLARFPRRIENVTVTIVRNPNPDGHAKRAAGNANGVVLDRNFPTARWRKVVQGPKLLSGRTPLSEPESQAIAQLLEDLQPDRVVLLGTASPKPTVLYAGPAEDLSRQLTLEAEGTLVPRDGDQLAGSLLMLTGEDRGIPTIRLGLPPRATAEEVFVANKRAIMTATGCGTPMPLPEVNPRNGGNATTQRRPLGAKSQAMATPQATRNESSPYLGGFGVPAGGDPFTARSTSTPGTSDQNQPTTMEFETISSGRPTVRIVSPRALRGPARAAAAPEAPSTLRAPIEGASLERRLERLPPVDAFPGPARSVRFKASLPQSPIPIHPTTDSR